MQKKQRLISCLCIFCFLLLCCTVHSQTPVSIAPIPKLQFLDVNGKPLTGGCLFTYAAGTVNPQATYTDSTGATQNTNPVILDSGGGASVWLSSQAYKFVVWSAGGVGCISGVQQYSVDGITTTNLNSTNQIISAAANPASTGFVRMANGDLVNWRNAANSADIGFSQGGLAAGVNGNLADVLRYGNASAGALQAQRFLDFSSAPAQSGDLAGGNNFCLVASRNAAGNADICAVLVNSSNSVVLGSIAGSTSGLAVEVGQFQPDIGIQGAGFQHTSVNSCTTPASANGTCNTTLTWPQSWKDSGYTTVCTLANNISGGAVIISSVVTTPTTATIQIANTGVNSSASQWGINCIGAH